MASHTHLEDVNKSSNPLDLAYFLFFLASLILSLFVKHRMMISEAIFLELTMPGVQVACLFRFLCDSLTCVLNSEFL